MIPLQTFRVGGQKYAVKIAITVALLVGIFLGVQYAWLGPELSASKVIQKDFVQTVVASGHVENPNRVDIGAQVTGTVAQVPVREGQLVQAGQVLIELENSEMQAALQQALANLLQAQAKLRQLQEVQAPVAQNALKQASINDETSRKAAQRAQELFNQGFVGQAALDEAHRAELVAKSQVNILQEQLNSVLPKGSDHLSAQAKAAADLAQAKLRYTRIVAPMAGTLISRNVETGDVVQAGKVLMVLSPTGNTELVVQIDEKHLKQLQLGQAAIASADAFNTEQFPATLSYVNPGVDAQRGSVLVKLSLPRTPTYLKQDMTVSVNIEVAQKDQAVLVTTDAIHDIDKAPWVQKVMNDRVVHQAIQLGLRGTVYCEALVGLKPDDIVLRDAAVLAPNKRVQAKLTPNKS
jgi:HlyD family secretion protein